MPPMPPRPASIPEAPPLPVATVPPGDIPRYTVVFPPQLTAGIIAPPATAFQERRDILLPQPMPSAYQFPAMRSSRGACALVGCLAKKLRARAAARAWLPL